MGLSSSSFNETRFYCHNRSDSSENIHCHNQHFFKMLRFNNADVDNSCDYLKSKRQDESDDREKFAIVTNPSISCISQIPTKGILKFQNLKKKVSKFKRKINCSNLDCTKLFYEFISNWSQKELQALRHEYDALNILRDIYKQANDSRPAVSSLMQDLDGLYKTGICADTEILYGGEIFKVHRAFLSTRSTYFRQCFYSWKAQPDIMLSSYNCGVLNICDSCHQQKQNKKPIPIQLDNPSITPDIFRSILQYIYTEQLEFDENQIDNWEMIYLLREKFHLPNRLQFDMKRLFEDTSDTDCILSFAQSSCLMNLEFSPFDPSLVSKNHNFMNFIRHYHVNSSRYSSGGGYSSDDAAVECEYNFTPTVSYEIPCHRAILSARSTFFKRIIEMKLTDHNFDNNNNQSSYTASQNQNYSTNFESIVNSPLRITLEENIISHRYARVLLYCIYTGQLNMQLIVTKHHYSDRRSPTLDLTASLKRPGQNNNHSSGQNMSHSLSETPSAAGLYIHTFMPNCLNCIRDVMQLYQIGSFIDFKLICHNCEDLLVRHITINNFLEILRWSSEPYGSPFVRRHVVSWMREKFFQIINSPFLIKMTKLELIEIISSQFTQVPEPEILQALIKWAEAQLESNPINVSKEAANNTNNNNNNKDNSFVFLLKDIYSKRTQSKNKYQNDPKLEALIKPFLPFINFNHFFPGTEHVLNSLVRRGIISTASFNGGGSSGIVSDSLNLSINVKRYWCRLISSQELRTELFLSPFDQQKYNLLSLDLPQTNYLENVNSNSGFVPFKGPRFVKAFYDQVKMLLSERSRNLKLLQCHDDSTGLCGELESIRPPGRIHPILIPPSQSHLPLLSAQHICLSEHNLSTTHRVKAHNYLNCRIINAIYKRVKDLHSGVLVQRALFMPCVSWTTVFNLLRLQALREYGLPDSLINEIFNEKLLTTCSTNDDHHKTSSTGGGLSDNIPIRVITSAPINRQLQQKSKNKSSHFSVTQNSKQHRKSNVLRSGENLSSSRFLNFTHSANFISETNPNRKSCHCKEMNELYHIKGQDLNLMTALSYTDSNIYKENPEKKSGNSYPASPSVLLVPSTLELNDVGSSFTWRKHKYAENTGETHFPSRRHSMKLMKNDNGISRDGFTTLPSQKRLEIEINSDNSLHSYNPWVFNGFNFKTTKAGILDSVNNDDHDHSDSSHGFYGDSSKAHSPIYGVKKYHHSLCVACNSLSQSSFHLNYMSRAESAAKTYCGNSDNSSSKEVEL